MMDRFRLGEDQADIGLSGERLDEKRSIGQQMRHDDRYRPADTWELCADASKKVARPLGIDVHGPDFAPVSLSHPPTDTQCSAPPSAGQAVGRGRREAGS